MVSRTLTLVLLCAAATTSVRRPPLPGSWASAAAPSITGSRPVSSIVSCVARIRPRPAPEPIVRFETAPGHHYGECPVWRPPPRAPPDETGSLSAADSGTADDLPRVVRRAAA